MTRPQRYVLACNTGNGLQVKGMIQIEAFVSVS